MSSKKHIIQVLSNTNFSIDYEDFSLSPQVELILLFQEPKYKAKITKDKKHFYPEKSYTLGEARFVLTLDRLNSMIGELQALAVNLQKFEQLASGLNSIIEANQRKPETPSTEQE